MCRLVSSPMKLDNFLTCTKLLSRARQLKPIAETTVETDQTGCNSIPRLNNQRQLKILQNLTKDRTILTRGSPDSAAKNVTRRSSFPFPFPFPFFLPAMAVRSLQNYGSGESSSGQRNQAAASPVTGGKPGVVRWREGLTGSFLSAERRRAPLSRPSPQIDQILVGLRQLLVRRK